MQKIKILLCSFIVISLLTGCWDRVEIEERGFVVGVAIDQAEDKGNKNQKKLMLTQQIVVPGVLEGSGSNLGGGGEIGDAYLNITAEGNSMFGIIRETAARTSRSPFYEHNALIIVSMDVASSKLFTSILDHFLRFPEMRRGTKVLISEHKAKKVLEVTPKNEKLPAMYINSISINNFKNARMLPVSRIGDIHSKLLREEGFTVQRIIAEEEEVKISGNAVFKGKTNELVGFLDEDETMGLNLLTGDIKGGVLEFFYDDGHIIFDIKKAKHQITANVEDQENISFLIKVESEGKIAEAFESNINYNPTEMKELEEDAAAEIERYMNLTINKLQQEFKVDVIGLGSYLNDEHPDVWKKLKSNWEENNQLFTSVKIDVEAKVNIRQPGTLFKSNER